MIKAIIFDNNGVLTYCDADRTVPAFAKYFGVDPDYLESFFHLLARPFDDGTITTEDFYKNIATKLGKSYDLAELRAIQIASYEPKVGMQELVRKLKENYKVALLTNLGDIYDEANAKMWHYETLFDAELTFVSYKLGMKKPEKQIYEYILAKLEIEPAEAIFVDDRESNLVPARELGMHTILFESREQLENELKLLLDPSAK